MIDQSNTSSIPFVFDDDILSRLKDFSSLVVPPKGVTEASDPFDIESIQVCNVEAGKPQAIPLAGSKEPGYSEVYRHAKSPDRLVTTWHPKVQTFYDAFQLTVARYPDRMAFADREYDEKARKWSEKYNWITFKQLAERRNNFASGMIKVVEKATGLSPTSRHYIVSIYGPNCSNWVVADLACQTQTLPSVVLYDTLGPESTQFILSFTESPVVVCSLAHIPTILKMKPDLPHIKVVISMGALHNQHEFEAAGQSKKELLSKWANQSGVTLYSMQEVEQLGEVNPAVHRAPSRDDIYALNFTSGTTGNPKGAILTHANVVAACTMPRMSVPINNKDIVCTLSYLPLAHIYERMNLSSFLVMGMKQGFLHGEISELLDDVKALKPSFIAIVPRVMNKIAASLKTATVEAPGMGGYISRKALDAKLHNLRTTGSVHHAFWDRVWSKKIRKVTGFENLRFISSGSAPASVDYQEFLKASLAAEVCQGYGLTESLSGICLACPNETELGTCGPISPTCEVRLRDVPELGYFSSDKPSPRGEIMLRGPQMFSGYYHNSEKTLESLDKDGWFHTGDVGKIDALGRIVLIDRVKNFFKLAQGEYIGAEKIENVYLSRNTLLAQMFIHGISTETYLVAICGVAPEPYAAFVSKLLAQPFALTDIAALQKTFDDKKVRNAFVKTLNDNVEPNALQGFERIKNAVISFEPLNIANDTLTPTLKVKRNVAAKVFDPQVQMMYKEGPVNLRERASL